MGVGSQLAEHASGLSAALVAVVDNAVNADNRAKSLAFELKREALNLPSAKFEQYVLYQSSPTAPEGGEAPPASYHIIKYYFLVPGIMFHDGRSLIIDYVRIKSSFEAHIKKTRSLSSDSSARVKGKIGMFGIPSLTVDITQKVHVAIGSENEQHNSFDVEMGMKQSDPPFGFMEIVKAIARNLERVMDFALEQGENNPIPITEDEAKELESKAGVPVTDANAEDNKDEES